MAEKLLKKPETNKSLLWGFASFVSLGLLALVVWHVDFSESLMMLQNASWVFLAAAFFFLLSEGVSTALRLWLFASKKPCLSQALKANAWYVLLLVMLPARLGEVAAVVVLERYLGQKYGAAAMSIITQRLYDVIILGVIFLIALVGMGSFIDTQVMGIVTTFLIGIALFVLLRLNMFLTIGALCMGKKRHGVLRKIKRLILQARVYNRHGLSRKDIPLALFFTIVKWVSNLAALVFLFMAIHLGLSLFENITVATAYNFLAIIPLQTVGGIGVGEAGLALLLVSMGLSKSVSAGASLMIRFVILVFPFIFWVIVMGSIKVKEKLSL